ncbi:hypothetical protein EO244_07120 [Ancylomarina salipaludis]|uniref:Uncharacterized protein n=1 Tax=Ancylomarina salipaludis TaxID=2501299 RepID=A0A4Q1JND4_9BACT|nr:hypothetical protein [Ancylomarina salipaludis]RXQ95626.1 hypothetical protein EO244_07120 [Ancylomarina salipaludis]
MELNVCNNMGQYLIDECIAMVKYLSAEGSAIPSEAKKIIDINKGKVSEWESHEILNLHKCLSLKVAPARPKTISLLYKEAQKNKWLAFLGPVGLVRRLMATTLLSLVSFILISLSPHVNNASVSKGILADHGFELLLNLMFFLSAAALGACFSNLFQANKYIVNGTYDPKYESSYWIRFVLGLIAGLMMAVLIPASLEVQQSPGIGFLTVPILAMLGGFSASLFYRILNRAVTTVDTLLTGLTDKNSDNKTQERLLKQNQQQTLEKQQIVEELLSLKAEVKEGDVNEKLKNTINKILMN